MKRISDIVLRIKDSSEFYNEKLKKYNDFLEFPFTTKSQLIDSQKQYPPYGHFTNDSKIKYQIYRTSGTSALPLLLSFTKEDVENISEIGVDCFRFSGMGNIGNEEIVINCLNLSMWAGGFFDSIAMMKTGVQVINFGTGNTSELINLINILKVKYKLSIHCTPSYLPIIQKRLKVEFFKEPYNLNIYRFYLGAEGGIQNNEFRNVLQNTWNCKIFNANYGMSEVCSIMASADDGNILRFSPLLFNSYYIELLNESGHIDSILNSKIGDEGDLVITSFFKQSQPLIRYHTKEKIRIVKNTKKTIFFEVIGRSDDMLVFKGINIFPEQFRNIILQFKELSGLYKILARIQDEFVSNIILICEVSNLKYLNNSNLQNSIQNKIKSQYTIKLEINLVEKIEFLGNKQKLVEFI